ncbi:TonB-dependent siderophore receptor [Phenylobacterium sp.]|uniref:TonB-dependent siderophore receptor n=1 Tax=Phenylobacterium sp. TaxID=1871053 RepID=UPI00301C74EF
MGARFAAVLLCGASSGHVLAAEADIDIESVVVSGRRIENYRAVDTLTGVKMDAELRDLPLSISVVSQELIQDRSLNQLGEALDNVSGAQRKAGYGGVQNFGAYLRGFDASFLTLRNGVRDFGFYTLRDTANVERFEVLKGPGSVLYGAVTPGGITNTITKKPTTEPLIRAQAVVGSFDRYRGELDAGGPIAGTLYGRLNVAADDAGSFRDKTGVDGYFIAPVLTWKATESLDWTVELEHRRSDYTWDLGLPRHPNSFKVPISRFLGEPDGVNRVESTFVASTIEWRLNEDWRLRQTTGYAWTDGDYALRSFSGVQADGRTVNRVAYDNWEKSHSFVVQNELVGAFQTGGLGHRFAAGVEAYETQQAYSFFFSGLAPIDLFAPVYGAKPQPGGFVLFADEVTNRALGVYAQDLISLGERWKLLVGARYDRVRNKSVNLMTGALARKSVDEGFSPQVGLVYQPDTATSLYASYGESFMSVTSGRTASGDDLDPEEGRQLEAGIKRTWLGGRLSTTLAAYHITKKNVSTPDPDNPVFRVQTGEQESKGVEFDVAGSPLPGWDMIFGLSYIDARVSRDNTFRVGSQLPGAPMHSASLWNKYTVQEGMLEGLELGLGVYYVDDRAIALPNPAFRLPNYVRVDAMAAYGRGPWRVQVNLKNLGDETIYDLSSTNIFPQEPRSVTVRLMYGF